MFCAIPPRRAETLEQVTHKFRCQFIHTDPRSRSVDTLVDSVESDHASAESPEPFDLARRLARATWTKRFHLAGISRSQSLRPVHANKCATNTSVQRKGVCNQTPDTW